MSDGCRTLEPLMVALPGDRRDGEPRKRMKIRVIEAALHTAHARYGYPGISQLAEIMRVRREGRIGTK